MGASLQAQAETKVIATPSFTPVHAGLLQRRPVSQAAPAPIVHEVLRSPGQPLDPATRTFMETRFGHDFSRVRVHTDAKAAESARAVNAQAYTVGQNIVLDAGRYAKNTYEGKKLIAHELTHTLQQDNKVTLSSNHLKVGPPGDACEQEANTVARRVVEQNKAQVSAPVTDTLTGSNQHIQRKPTFSPECNSYRRCNVIEPLVHAKQMVDAVLTELPPAASGSVTTGRIVDLLNVHFHTASAADAATILDNFRQIRSELDASVRYVCHDDNPSDCEMTPTGFVGGYTTCAPGADVHLCALYHSSLSCEEQARVLVHEIAHHVPGICGVETYVGQAEYMTIPSSRTMRNADTYAQFAKMVFLGAPSCKDCGFEIQVGGRNY